MITFVLRCDFLIRCSFALVGLLLVGAAQAAPSDETDTPVFGAGDSYYTVEHLNAELPKSKESVNLQTPQSSLENFIFSSREGEYERAAQSLNFNLIPRSQRKQKAAELAAKLYYVINQTFWIDWGEIPDRPDGQKDAYIGSNDPLAGKPRRVIPIGTVELGGRDVDINLARVRPGDKSPVWVISAQTVENIEELYATHGPGLLDQYLPEWMKVRLAGSILLYQWIGLVVLVFAAAGLGWIVQYIVVRIVESSDSRMFRGMAHSVPGPMSILFSLVTFYILYTALLSLPGPVTSLMNPTVSILIIAAFTWLAMRGVGYASDYVHENYIDSIREHDDNRARKLLTNISVARRVLIFIAFFAGLGIALAQLEIFKTVGMSLLASAGVAAVVLGVAARDTLGNIMAGVQIAISQPVRIGDNVYFDEQWGDIEEITYTYLTLRTWDHRRLIIPLTDFISRPIENWSKNQEFMIKPVHVYADYRIDVEKVRKAFIQMAQECEELDDTVAPSLEVVECTEKSIMLRGVACAKDPYAAWDMHCRLREQLIVFIREMEEGLYLPRRRMETYTQESK